jgi:hypothetical protein
MVSENEAHDDQNPDKPSSIVIPVQVEHVDQLVLIAPRSRRVPMTKAYGISSPEAGTNGLHHFIEHVARSSERSDSGRFPARGKFRGRRDR